MEWGIFGWLLLAVVCGGVLVLGVTGLCIIVYGATRREQRCDYILVLGARIQNGIPSCCLRRRICRAYDYLLKYPTAVAVVTGCAGKGEPISEAQCMFDALTAMGIPPERIWLEENATFTWENLKYSMELIEKRTGSRPGNVGVVSSDYHLFRVWMYGRAQKLSLVNIPSKTETFTRWFPWFIREIAGVWHFIFLGGTYDQHQLR